MRQYGFKPIAYIEYKIKVEYPLEQIRQGRNLFERIFDVMGKFVL